jgi:flagellin-like hook-associated protein FlgL
MAVQSINVNRVSNTLRTDALLATLRRSTLDLFKEQNRISTGRQFLAPSEDPGRAARALNLSEILDQQDQLLVNIRHGGNVLDATDQAMAEASSLVIDAQSVASQNIGTLSSDDEREAAAEVVASIREQLVAVGNRTFEGRYLFAGRKTDIQPFVSALGGTAFLGDGGNIFARTDVDELEEINLGGDVIFGALSSSVQGYVDLNPRLTLDTRIEDLTGATLQGVRLGSFEIVEEGGVGSVTVNLADADTIGDVVARINAAGEAAGASFLASVTDTGISIAPGGPPLVVRDISTGTTAADLGVVTSPASASAIMGADLGPALSRTTLIADLNGGAGVDLSGGLVITNAGQAATIDLSAAESVQDVLNTINNSGLHVRAEINAARNGINVINTVSGTTMTVGENGGTTANALGIRSLHGGSTLNELNNGLGVRTVTGEPDLRITAKNGSAFAVNLDGAASVQDVLDAINLAGAAAGVAVTAQLADVGNGIRLIDTSGGAGPLEVTRMNNSFAIDDLGLFAQTAAGVETELIGDDVNGARANGLLTALFDLEKALRDDDSQDITIAAEALDAHLVDFNRARGIVGARAKAMQDRLTQTEGAVFATQELLSEVQDLDYTEAVTKFQQAQTALQASLLTGSRLANTSLLDFLG